MVSTRKKSPPPPPVRSASALAAEPLGTSPKADTLPVVYDAQKNHHDTLHVVATEALAPPRASVDTDISYRRFLHWYASGVDGGRRSMAAVADAFGVDVSSIAEQARRCRWTERAAAHDRVLLAKELDEGVQAQRKAVLAQVTLAHRLTAVLTNAVAELEQLEGADAIAAIPAAAEAGKALKQAQAAIMAALQMPGSPAVIRVEHARSGKPDESQFDDYSDEEIAVMAHLERLRLKRENESGRG
jgi:hypothetical protein